MRNVDTERQAAIADTSEQGTLWSINDASRYVNHLSPYMIRSMIRSGKIVPIQLGRRLYVVKEELLRLVYETNRCK